MIFGGLSVISLAGGVLNRFFFPAYSPLICFKYKNNLADTWVDVSLGCSESLIKKLLSVLFHKDWDSKPVGSLRQDAEECTLQRE